MTVKSMKKPGKRDKIKYGRGSGRLVGRGGSDGLAWHSLISISSTKQGNERKLHLSTNFLHFSSFVRPFFPGSCLESCSLWDPLRIRRD